MVKVYGYTKCTTVKKGLKFLNDHNVVYTHIDNVENKLSVEELTHIYNLSNLDIKRMFNTSGIKYRELGLKDKLLNMTIDEKLELLATDGMLVKRPLLVTEEQVLVGFKAEAWESVL